MQSRFYSTAQEKNNDKFKTSCFIIFSIVSLLVLVFYFFNIFYVANGSHSLKLTDWVYSGSEKINEIRDNDRIWVTADSQHPVKVQDKSPYIILKGKLPKSDTYDTVAIKTANSTISVEVDREILYNTLKKKPLLAGSNISISNVSKSDTERDIEIILYAPLAFDVDVYYTTSRYAGVSAAAIPYFDIIFAFIFIGITLLVFAFTQRRRFAEMKRFSLCLLIVGLLSGVSVIVNPIYTSIQIGDAIVLFKLGAFINVLLSGLILFLAVARKLKWNSLIEGIIGINVLYAVCVFFSPYDLLTIGLMKLCTILQVGNLCMFFYMINKYSLTISALDISVYLCYAISSILHWYGIANQLRFDFRLPMLLSAFIFVAITLVSIYVENDDQAYARALERKPVIKRKPQKVKATAGENQVEAFSEYTQESITIITKPDEEIVAKKRGNLYFPRLNNVFEFQGVLEHIVSEKCDGESHHLLHVAEYVRVICVHMGMSEERAMFVAKASLLHDIGKICIPHDVLLKTGTLLENEYNLIRSHNIHGYNILNDENDRFLKMAAQIAREHHENYDGTGYLGLKGEEINLYARIVTVADVFDAVTSARAYKKAWSFEEGIKYIEKQKYDYFDPDIATVFITCQDEIYEIYKAFDINARLYGI